MGVRLPGGIEILQQERHEAHDGPNQIVEIMGNSAGQPPDGLHLLGLSKLLFAPQQRFLACPVPRAGFAQEIAQPQDRLALPCRGDLLGLREVGGNERLGRQQVLRLYPVAQHQPWIEFGKQRPRHGANAASSAGRISWTPA